MNTLFLAANNNNMGTIWTLGFIVIMFAFMYFTMIKPQKKQQQKKMEMMNELKKGDNVIMIDGLHGKVDSVNTKDKTVIIDADGIYLTFSRMAVQQIVPAAPAASEETPTAEKTPATPADDQKNDQPSAPSEKPTDTDDQSEE